MPDPSDTRRYRANLQDEIDRGELYLAMAERGSQPQLATLYRKLADIELRHAAFWEEPL